MQGTGKEKGAAANGVGPANENSQWGGTCQWEQPMGWGLPMRAFNQPHPGQHREGHTAWSLGLIIHSAQQVRSQWNDDSRRGTYWMGPIVWRKNSQQKDLNIRGEIQLFSFVLFRKWSPDLACRLGRKDLAKKEDSAERVRIKRCQGTTWA